MSASVAGLTPLFAAFWVAVFVYRRREPEGVGALRFVLGLGLGALFAHFGWALLYLERVWSAPVLVLDLGAGFSVLFVPLGLLAAAPWRAGPAQRQRFLASALASLPLALATARLGCLAAGCCHGVPTDLPWGVRPGGAGAALHPTAAYDILGLLVLFGLSRRTPDAWMAPVVLGGIGALRLFVEPWRAAPPLGAPALPVSLLASLWIVAAVFLLPHQRSAAWRGPVPDPLEGRQG